MMPLYSIIFKKTISAFSEELYIFSNTILSIKSSLSIKAMYYPLAISNSQFLTNETPSFFLFIIIMHSSDKNFSIFFIELSFVSSFTIIISISLNVDLILLQYILQYITGIIILTFILFIYIFSSYSTQLHQYEEC